MAMIDLRRVSTQYINEEDRIRLIAETSEDDCITIWLTRPFCDHILVLPIRFVELQARRLIKNSNKKVLDNLCQLLQEKVMLNIIPQENHPFLESVKDFRARNVSIKTDRDTVTLIFKLADGNDNFIDYGWCLAYDDLRRWLQQLCYVYRQAGWNMNIWPVWIHDVESPISHQVTIKRLTH